MRLHQFLAICATLCCTSAIPLGNTLQPRDNITTGISQILLNNFQLFQNFTAASYCPSNENATANSPITCPTGICPLVEADNVISLLSFGGSNDTSLTDIKGFISLDPSRSLIIAAFAGSGATIRNWLTDFTFLLIPSTLCDSCWVHSGFALGWAERRTAVLNTITAAMADHANYSLVLTGHSIGAAIATLAAAELRNLGHSVDTYTFGSPRVGNLAFADFVTGQATQGLGANYRMTHVNDPVPQLPPTEIGFQHTSPEFWLEGGNATTDEYTAGEVWVCEGVGNEGCNAGTGLVPIDGTAHDHYLGDIGACEGGLGW